MLNLKQIVTDGFINLLTLGKTGKPKTPHPQYPVGKHGYWSMKAMPKGTKLIKSQVSDTYQDPRVYHEIKRNRGQA